MTHTSAVDSLEQCPFCGWAAKPFEYEDFNKPATYHNIVCTNVDCPADELVISDETPEAAAAKWNRRALSHPPGGSERLRDVGCMRAQADAWMAVTEVLNEVAPDWINGNEVGRDCACNAIRRLASPQGAEQRQEELYRHVEREPCSDGCCGGCAYEPAATPHPAQAAIQGDQQGVGFDFCWLVELFRPYGGNSLGQYRAAEGPTARPEEATRYASRKDAEFAASKCDAGPDTEWRAVEHGFQRALPEPEARRIGVPAVEGLHPDTEHLVAGFAHALAQKLAAAEKKYGYSNGWMRADWMDECRAHLLEHVAKGDPRDVAAYCAFLWHHGERTAKPSDQQGASVPLQKLNPVGRPCHSFGVNASGQAECFWPECSCYQQGASLEGDAIVELRITTRNPEHYVMHNTDDGGWWRGTVDGTWSRIAALASGASPTGVQAAQVSDIERAVSVMDRMPELQRLLELRRYEHDSDLPMPVEVSTSLIDGVMYEVRDTISNLQRLAHPGSAAHGGEDGISLIAAERQRQVRVEGWTPDHDNEHDAGELAMAAACYAEPNRWLSEDGVPPMWPWQAPWWKPQPHDRVRELVKAGALIAAEIDRLQRAATTSAKPENPDV